MALLKIHKDYMLFLQRLFKLALIFVLSSNTVAQNINSVFYRDSVKFYLKHDTACKNKMIPAEFSDAIHIALQFYPELNTSKIKFRTKKTMSPLAARPTFWAIFRKPSKRKYIITISSSTNKKLTSILLKNLSFNSQVGVIGHELAHISFYNTKKGIYFIRLALMHLNKRAIDRFEFNTDKRCIEHGLGHQLLSWSNEVRAKLDLKQWGGANSPMGKRERYMNPETIMDYMNKCQYIFLK